MKKTIFLAALSFASIGPASVAHGNVTAATVTSEGQSHTLNIVHQVPSPLLAQPTSWAFIYLPVGYSPSASSETGVVLLYDATCFYRWSAGGIENLHPRVPYPADGYVYSFGSGSARMNADGDIALGWHFYDRRSGHYRDVDLVKIWSRTAVAPRELSVPVFTYTVAGYRDVSTFYAAIASLNAIDDSESVWVVEGLETVPFDVGTYRLRKGLVRVDTAGTIFQTPLQQPDVLNGSSFVVNGINGAGIAIGQVAKGVTKSYFVGENKVDFEPVYANKNGWMLGLNSNKERIVIAPDGTRAPTPSDGTVTWIDNQNRLNGYYNPPGQASRNAVWVEKKDADGQPFIPADYQRIDYVPLQAPESWTTNHKVAPGTLSRQLGIMTRTDGSESRPFLAIPAELAVDGDRDGRIKLASTGASDAITVDNPYRFWINDDDDIGPAAGDNMPGQAANKADYNNTTVDSIRDLVDFFPVYLDIKQLLGVLPHTTAGITYKLKQADGALNFVYTNLTNEYLAAEKRSRAFDYQYKILTTGFGPSFTQAAAEATAEQITAAGVPLNTAFLDGIKNNDWGVILVEGRTVANPTHAPLRLVVEKGGVEIAEISLHLKISPIEEMFRHVNLTAQVDEYVSYGSGNHITPPKPGVPTNTAQPTDYPDSLTNGKYFVFLHGFNVDADSARGWNAEVFKRMHTMGSKARFVGVQWNGSPPSIIPGKYLDYHKAVFQAFQTGDLLAGALSFTNGADVTIAAHSLGNIVTSHAIQSGGFTPSRYYMINAASPIEAYSLSDAAGQFDVMRHERWVPYETRLYASKWHELFAATPSDNRNALTWKLRFPSVLPRAHNFFSGEEDVVADGDQIDDASILEIIVEGNLPAVMAGEYSWKLQEIVKGASVLSSAAAAVLERRQGGWGFSTEWNVLEDIQPGPGTNWQSHRRLPNDTGSIPSDGLKTEPFFRRFLESDLMSANATVASNKAGEAKVKYDLLARAIPAMSNAVAANRLDSIGTNNYNMPVEAKKNGWYDAGNRWRHSDFCYVALPYVYPMFQEMISRGGLNQ